MIPFNVPPSIGNEKANVEKVMKTKKLSGGGEFTEKCTKLLEEHTGCKKVLLISSFAHALEMCAVLLGIGPGDEVIMPFYSSNAAANAFLIRGAKVVFIDINPDTMNMNEQVLDWAVTEKTKVIVPFHYAGVACHMDTIMKIAQEHNLYVVENAEHALLGKYRGKYLGTIGHFGCFSFHDHSNYSCGEGGALFVNDPHFFEKAERFRDEGIDHSTLSEEKRKELSWVDIGSSYRLSDLHAAYLHPQLVKAKDILQDRLKNWNTYYKKLKPLEEVGLIELPWVPGEAEHNGNLFFIKVKNKEDRNSLIKYLKYYKIESAVHYMPLHSSPAGRKYCAFSGQDQHGTRESLRLLRLPLYYGLSSTNVNFISGTVSTYYNYAAIKEKAPRTKDFKAI